MPTAQKNAWTSGDEPLATWVAELSPARSDPSQLAGWLDTVLRAGEAQQVYSVREAPLVGFPDANHEAAFPAFLERRGRETAVVDLFQFASSGMRTVNHARFRTVARMAYFDAKGAVVEAEVDDVGALLARLRPETVETAPGLVKRAPPIWASGPKIDFRDPSQSVWDLKPERVRVRFSILSEIWLPFVRGFLEPEFADDLRYDNRPLAQQHTPRFNAFLDSARTATGALGGAWSLDPEGGNPGIAYMVSAAGINLGAAPPRGVSVREAD